MRFTHLALLCALVLAAVPAQAREVPLRSQDRPTDVASDSDQLLYSTSAWQHIAARETAGPDTFVLYGGPDQPLQGKFEDAEGLPDFNGWTSVDLSDQGTFWRVSTFGAENLNNNGVGNHAFWCGQDAAEQPSWVSAPGYGNNWEQQLVWESGPVASPESGQVVELDFFFNLELEDGYDYFLVEYEINGSWQTALEATGSNPGVHPDYPAFFAPPGVQYGTHPYVLPIEYTPFSYAGPDQDQIRIRFRVMTDAIWSDEDGFFPTALGAVQLDDVSITWSDGVEFEDFEGPGPWKLAQEISPFAGDFASILHLLTDLDPCRSNITPAAAFIDFGQAPVNGPGPDGTVSTGGSTSPNVEYGIAGHYIVHPDGGLAAGNPDVSVYNVIVSPEIPWNLPGSADDGDEFVGVELRYDLWNDLPTSNLVGRIWAVRSRTVGGNWEPWSDRGLLFIGDQPVWRNISDPVGDLLLRGGTPDVVQFRLGVWDASLVLGYTSADATPAPVYDNVALYKYRVDGPAISTRAIELSNDGFPAGATLDVSTQAARDALDIPFDMAKDITRSGSAVIVVGDSVTVDVEAMIPGTSVVDVRMVWALQKNPLFEDEIRSLPARPQDQNTAAGAELWTGEVVGQPSTIFGGVVANRYFMDLPDVDCLYPGDVLHYYFQARDSAGRTTTLPVDTSSFLDFTEYTTFSREFMVRGLPSLRDTTGSQPGILVINDAEAGREAEFLLAFRELGAVEGAHFDTYRVQGANSLVSNGIGSDVGHGANAEQVAGYENILYLSGSLTRTLSDGTDFTDGNLTDKSDDIGLITAWSQQPGTRRIAYFGDSITESLRYGSIGPAFLASQIGVEFVAADVVDVIGGQTAPRVEPVVPAFFSEFVVSAGCPGPANLDHIRELGGTVPFRFLDPVGEPVAAAAAAVMMERTNGFDILFPYAFYRIESPVGRILPSPRALLLQELFGLQSYCIAQPCTGAPALRVVTLSVLPNPFNPSTVIRFTAAVGARGSVTVYNLRGERVRLLHDGEFQTQEFRWDGADSRGAAVASGVYVVRAEVEGAAQTAKVALVK